MTTDCLDESEHFVLLITDCLDESEHFVFVITDCLDESEHFVLVTTDCLDESEHFVLVTTNCLDESEHFVLVTTDCLDESEHFVLVTTDCLDESEHSVLVITDCLYESEHFVLVISECLDEMEHFVLVINDCLDELDHIILDVPKPIFGISDKATLKPASSSTETSLKIQNLLVASYDMILCNKQITKALIRLHWSASLLFANPRRQNVEAHSVPVNMNCQDCNVNELCSCFIAILVHKFSSRSWNASFILELENEKMFGELPLETASKLLEENDFQDVLNRLPDETFDLFTSKLCLLGL